MGQLTGQPPDPRLAVDCYNILKDELRHRAALVMDGQPLRWLDAVGVEGAAPRILVHILHKGCTLCGISTRPVDWQQTEQWVPLDAASGATCIDCLNKYTSQQPW